MLKRSAYLFVALVSVFLFYLFCAPIDNPFSIDKTDISLTFKYSKGIHTGDALFTDTVNNKIKIGISSYQYNFIDSVTISFLSSSLIDDTTIVYKKIPSGIDTAWDSISFALPGTRTITSTLYVQNGTTKVYNG